MINVYNIFDLPLYPSTEIVMVMVDDEMINMVYGSHRIRIVFILELRPVYGV